MEELQKSSIRGNYPNINSQNLQERSEKWIKEARNRKIANKNLVDGGKEFATEVFIKWDMPGYKIKPLYATVKVPEPGPTGIATVNVQPWSN